MLTHKERHQARRSHIVGDVALRVELCPVQPKGHHWPHAASEIQRTTGKLNFLVIPIKGIDLKKMKVFSVDMKEKEAKGKHMKKE